MKLLVWFLFVVCYHGTATAHEERLDLDAQETTGQRMSLVSLFKHPFLLNDIPEGFTLADLGVAGDSTLESSNDVAAKVVPNEIVPRSRKGPNKDLALQTAQRQLARRQRNEPKEEEDESVAVRSRASSVISSRRSQTNSQNNGVASYKKGTFKPQPKKLVLPENGKKKPLGWPFLSDFDSDTNLASILSSFERKDASLENQINKNLETELTNRQKQGNINHLREKLSRRQSSKISDRLGIAVPVNRQPKSNRLRNAQKPQRPNPVAQQQPTVARNPAPVREQLRNRNIPVPALRRQASSRANQVEAEPKSAPKEEGVIEELSASGEFTLRRPRKPSPPPAPVNTKEEEDGKSQVQPKQPQVTANSGLDYYEYDYYEDQPVGENQGVPSGLLSRRADLSGDYIILTQNGAGVAPTKKPPTTTTTTTTPKPSQQGARRDSRANILRSRNAPAASQSTPSQNTKTANFESGAYSRIRSRPNRAPDADLLNTLPSVHRAEFKVPSVRQLQGSSSNQRTQTSNRQGRGRVGFTRSDVGTFRSSQEASKSAEAPVDSVGAESRSFSDGSGEVVESVEQKQTEAPPVRTRGNRAQIIRSPKRISEPAPSKVASSSREEEPKPAAPIRQRRPVSRPPRPSVGQPLPNATPTTSAERAPARSQRTRTRQPRPSPPPQEQNSEEEVKPSSTTQATRSRRVNRPIRPAVSDLDPSGIFKTRDPSSKSPTSVSVLHFGEERPKSVERPQQPAPAATRTRTRGSRGNTIANAAIVSQLRGRTRNPVGAPAPESKPAQVTERTSLQTSRIRRPTPPTTTTTTTPVPSPSAPSAEVDEEEFFRPTTIDRFEDFAPTTTPRPSKLDDIDESTEVSEEPRQSQQEQNNRILENLARLSLPPEATEAFLSAFLGTTEAPVVKSQEKDEHPELNVTIADDKFIIHRPRTEHQNFPGRGLNRGQAVLKRKTPITTSTTTSTTSAPVQRTRGSTRGSPQRSQPIPVARPIERTRSRFLTRSRAEITTEGSLESESAKDEERASEEPIDRAPFPQYTTLTRNQQPAVQPVQQDDPQQGEFQEEDYEDEPTADASTEQLETETEVPFGAEEGNNQGSRIPVTTWSPLGFVDQSQQQQQERSDSFDGFFPSAPQQLQNRPLNVVPFDVNSAGIPSREFRQGQFSLPRPDANGVLRFGEPRRPGAPFLPGTFPNQATFFRRQLK